MPDTPTPLRHRGRSAACAAGVILAVALAVAAALGLGAGHPWSLSAVQAQQAQLAAWGHARPLATGVAFFGAFVASAALSVPGIPLLSLAAGAVLGPWWGLVVASFASAMGATLAFLASRALLRDWVGRRFGARMSALDDGVRRHGAWYLLTLRLVPVFPASVINLGLGVTALRPWTFYWVSQLGMLVAIALYVNAGTRLAQLNSLRDVATPTVWAWLFALILLPWLVKLGIERRLRAARA